MATDASTSTKSAVSAAADPVARREMRRGAAGRPTASQWEPIGTTATRTWLRGVVYFALALIAVGALIWVAYERHVAPRTGTVASLDGSRLMIRDGGSAPWTAAGVDRPIRQGAELESIAADPDATGTALLRFPDGAQVRLDSLGTWQIVTLLASRNGRISELTIRQLQGQITAASPPIRRFDVHHLYFQVPGHTIALSGVATLRTDEHGITHLTVHQGVAELHIDNQTIAIDPTQTARLWPGALPELSPAQP